MGEVYRARDPRLQRDVALKILPPDRSTPTLRARFEHEVHAVAALSHPNIVAIFDVGVADGVAYAVMELLDGETLRERMHRPFTVPDATTIATQIARGVRAAHDRGLLHRDLKPENVFILGDGRIKVVDFGLVGELETVTTGETRLTSAGTVMGTIGYMPPEQLRGGRCDRRTDVFALGVMLYEMLAGHRPFIGATSSDVVTAVLRDEPAPLRRFRPEVPTSLEAAVHRCLAKPLEDRFQSVDALLEALTASVPAAGSAAQPPSHAAHVSIGAIAVLPFVDFSASGDQGYLCDGIAEELISALVKLPDLRVTSRSASFQFRGSGVDLKEVSARLGVAAVLEGSVRVAGNRMRLTVRLNDVVRDQVLWSDRFDRTVADVFAVQEEIATTVTRLLAPSLGVTLPTAAPKGDAYQAFLKGRHAWNTRTAEGFDAGVVYFQEAIAADPGFARAYAGLADVYALQGIYGLAPPAEVMPAAIAAARDALSRDPNLTDALATLGLVQAMYDWDWTEAERTLRRAMEAGPDYATAHHYYALNVLTPLGRFDEALEELGRAIALDPAAPVFTLGRGTILYLAGRQQEAVSALHEVLAFDPQFPPAHFFLGAALTELGNFGDARRHLSMALAERRETPELLAARGYLAAREDRRGEAEAVLDRLRATAAGRYVSPVLLAQILAGLGETDATFAELERAVTLRASDLAWVAARPMFAPLRSDPRFRSLLARLGTASAETGQASSEA